MDKALILRVQAAMNDKLSGPLGRIRDRAGAAGRDMVQLRERLRGLNAAQRDIGEFRELSAGLRNSRGELAAAQQRVAQLAVAIRTTQTPTRQMQRDFDAAKASAGRLKREVSEKAVTLERLRGRLSAASVSTTNLAEGERALRSRIAQTNSALTDQASRLKSVAAAQQRAAHARESYDKGRAMAGGMAGAGAAGVASGGAALFAGSKLIAPGLDFDFSMSKVQALARLEQTDPQMIALRAQARDLGATTMYTAGQAADAQGFLAMAGFKPNAIISAMPGMLSLAKAGDTELAQTADIASNILTGFNLPAQRMNNVSDILVATFTRSNVSLAMLGDTMKYVGPVAAGVGVDLETAAAMAGKLGDAGIQGSMGGTALRAILGRLAAPPKMAADALKQLGIKTADAKGNLRDLPAILAEIDAKTRKFGNAKRAGFFKAIAGEEAFSALQVLTQQASSGELQKFVQINRKPNGEAQKAASTMADNLRGDLDELSSAWEDLGIELEEQNDGALRDISQGITGLIGKAKAWAVENPVLSASLAKVAAVGAVVVTGLGALTLAMASVLGPFVLMRYGMTMLGMKGIGLAGALASLARGGFGMLATALTAVSRLFLMNPIGLAATAIGLAAYGIYSNWGQLSGFFSGLWSRVLTTFDRASAAVADGLRAMDPMPWLSGAWSGVSNWFASLWQRVRGVFSNASTGISSALQAMDPMPWLSRAWGGVSSWFASQWQAVASVFDRAGVAVSTALGAMNPVPVLAQSWDGLSGWFAGIWQNVSAVFDGGLTALSAGLSSWSPLTLLQEAATNALGALGLQMPGEFGELGRNLMQGLVNGVRSMGGAVKEAISEMGGGVISWFKEKLGIHSPSRVMAAMGEYVSEGAAVGINSGRPQAMRAARTLAASVALAGALAPPVVPAAEFAEFKPPKPVELAASVALNRAEVARMVPAAPVSLAAQLVFAPAAAPGVLDQPAGPPQTAAEAIPRPKSGPTSPDARARLVAPLVQPQAREAAPDSLTRFLRSIPEAFASGPLGRILGGTLAALSAMTDRMQALQMADDDAAPQGMAIRPDDGLAVHSAPALAFDTSAALVPRQRGTVTVQGDTINIHITPAAGTSPAEIARQIEAALQRRDSQKAARARSMYRDDN